MLARTINHSWVKHLVVGMLALVFVPLSGPVFFCKCEGQVITVSQLKTNAECCATHCQGEAVSTEDDDCCSEEPSLPCDKEIDLVFASPDNAGGQVDTTPPMPVDAVVPGDFELDLARLALSDSLATFATTIPPPELAVTWQFVSRTALPSRAPSIAS